MPLTKAEIISRTVELLGKGPIASTLSAGKFAQVVDNFYELLLPATLAINNWRFATAIQQLSRLVAVPIVSDWSYAFQLPANFLALRRLYPHTTDFQIYENKLLYANASELTLEYRFVPDASRFPEYFVEYFIYRIGVRLAVFASADETTLGAFKGLEKEAYVSALFADGSSHPTQPIQSAPVIDCRG